MEARLTARGPRSAHVSRHCCSARLVWWCWVCYARKILKIERAVASFCATSEKLQLSTNHLACHHVAVALDDA